MKKTASNQFVMYEQAQPSLNDVNALHLMVKHVHKRRKKIAVKTFLASMLSKELASEGYISFANLLQMESDLNDTTPAVQKYHIELQIRASGKAFDKAASKYNSLEEKSKKLEKEKMDIEGKIQKNQHRLQVSSIEVEARRHQLAAYFTQRKNRKISEQTIVKV